MGCVRCHLPVAPPRAICAHCGAPQPRARPRSELEDGTQIERPGYRLVTASKLGAGGMGAVYRAFRFWDPRGPRGFEGPEAVALKVLLGPTDPGAGSLAAAQASFVTEALALRTLDHPNVVRFFDLFHVDTKFVLCMELVEGDTLEAVIARHVARAKSGGLPGMAFLRAWSYFEQLLGALSASHALGIIHRDVKPSNVLVRADGLVKLSDFGIATLAPRRGTMAPQMPDASGAAAPEGSEEPVGTGLYMSPEQVMGGHVTAASDLYSAALVLYEMLTGRSPYDTDGKTEWALRFLHVECTPIAIRRFVPQMPPAMDALFARALAKNPAARFASGIEFGDAVRQILALPASPAWEAQRALAREVSRFRGRTQAVPTPGVAFGAVSGIPDLQSLRGVIAERYVTAPLAPKTNNGGR